MPLTSGLRRWFAGLLLATAGIFGALIAGLTWQLRARLHTEILRREAEAIHAVAQLQLGAARDRAAATGGTTVGAAELFLAVLESSKLGGVLALEVFEPDGKFHAALPDVPRDVPPAPPALAGSTSAPLARFDPDGSLETAYGIAVEPGAEPTRVPLLEIVVPMARNPAEQPLGTARYWIDGRAIAAEFRRLDRGLWQQAGLAFVGATLLAALLLAWSFRRLAAAQLQLLAQRADLARANEELDFAAKTGALGAISAHLIHGLKNPLAGLEGFVAETANAPAAAGGEAWQLALETTRRLRASINEVVSVLADESTGADHAVPVDEVLDAVRTRAAPLADRAGVEVTRSTSIVGSVGARTGNLTSLVLTNLVTNAIEASPRGGEVQLQCRAGSDAAGPRVEFDVVDQGPGLSPAVRDKLFRPLASTKRGGGGIGLAISHRLARHAGGGLELVRSGPDGTVFRLWVPAAGLTKPM